MKERVGPDNNSWTAEERASHLAPLSEESEAERRRVSRGAAVAASSQHRLPCRQQELGVVIRLNPQVVETELRNPFEFSRGTGGEEGGGRRLMELEVSPPEGADRCREGKKGGSRAE